MQDASVSARLERAREELLDLTLRNRLLNTPRHRLRAKTLEIVDERGDEVFRLLVRERKSLYFLPAKEVATESDERIDESTASPDLEARHLPQPELDEGQQLVAARHTDAQLQTKLESDRLQSRLLGLYYDARTIEQEQGVDILYLAVGFLKWFEDDRTDKARYAPLILVPVSLERTNARSRFRLELADDTICTNLSLEAKLKTQFGIQLPPIEDGDEWLPGDYFAQVNKAIEGAPRWEVCPDDIVLGLFSFAKFLLYRDLAAESWPPGKELSIHPLVTSLLGEGTFPQPPADEDGDKDLDGLIDPARLTHVVDADSSQTVAMEDVGNGRNLVIQGPPGTGKSQTITNLIAAAVQNNKTVLFVAEKMAALEVVKRRLDQVGLGNTCLELHSQKSKKTAVLDQLRTTLDAEIPPEAPGNRQIDALRSSRDQLNRYVARLHEPVAAGEPSAFEIMGEMIALNGDGLPPRDFDFPGSAKWTPADRANRQQLVAQASKLIEQIGLPNQHPWRGLGLETMLPSDAGRIESRLLTLRPALEAVERQARELSESLGLKPVETMGAIDRRIRGGRTLAAMPAADVEALADPCWSNQRDDVLKLVQQGKNLQELKQRLAGKFSDAAWRTDVTATRRELAARGRNWFRWVFPAYRQARLAYRNLCQDVPAGGPSEWVADLDLLIKGQQIAKWLEAQSALGSQAFGRQWRGADSNWEALAAVSEWVQRVYRLGAERCLPLVLAGRDAMAPHLAASNMLAGSAQACRKDMESLLTSLQLDVDEAFSLTSDAPGKEIAWRCPHCGSRIKAVSDWKGQQSTCPACGEVHECGLTLLDAVPLGEIRSRIHGWQSALERASEWIAYRVLRDKMRTLGLTPLVDRLDDGRIAAPAAVGQFRLNCHESLLRRRLADWPELARFQGRLHEQIAADFCQHDRELLQLAQKRVARSHAQRVPRGDARQGVAGRNAAKNDPLGLIRHEINKKRRHLPVRQLLEQAGEVVQRIKPVFMMSPMSIAQYLPPGRLEFDLLIMDEASQVRPCDALGAVARTRQIVIVGDDQQLPPTRFFNTLLEDAAAGDELIDADTRDLESILDLCNARGVPSRMLRWHYRSRHHSLIAVSNREFYQEKLIVVPSPVPCSADLGVSFCHIPSGVFDRGGTATNRSEAREVARAVMDHASRSPQRSLGVGCFSVAQRDVILEELEALRRDSAAAESFFATDAAEPFFVKNLENIQGDERDEIYISVGYGRDAAGRLTMNFGPLSADGGQRRLNVLITRARRRCTVFSSIVADDIDLNRASGRGPLVLKSYLAYCQQSAGEVPQGHGLKDDALGHYLVKRLTEAGLNVVSHVGLAGLYVDLGIADPAGQGRFCLGVEWDGANYRSARWARDRDRLRGQVLADHGWKLIRIWTPDWFYRPDVELRRVLQEVEAAREMARQSAARAPVGSEAGG